MFGVIERSVPYTVKDKPNEIGCCPEFDLIKKMKPGDSILIENGATGKNPEKNWRPYHYGNKYGKSKGWCVRAKKVEGGHLRIWRLT